MSGKVDMTLPPDMLIMLGKMDGKLDSLLTQTASNTTEIKEVSARVSALEADGKESRVLRDQFKKVVIDVEELKTAKSEATGGIRGAALVGNAAKMALGALGGVLALLGAQIALTPKNADTIKSEITVERNLRGPAIPRSTPLNH